MPPSIVLLTGEDDFRIAEAIAEAQSEQDPGLGDLNRIRLDGARLAPAALREQLEAMPFLADRRIVTVDGLLGRYESGVKSKAKTTEAGDFVAVLEAAPPTVLVLLVEGKIELKKNPIASTISRTKMLTRSFPLLRHSELMDWIRERSTRLGVRLDADAVHLLAETVGPNLWSLRSELEKAALWAEGKVVTADDIRLLVAEVREARIFELVDAIVAGEGRGTLEQLGRMLDGGLSPFNVLALIQNRVRTLWTLRYLIDAGEPGPVVQQRGGIAHMSPYVADKLIDVARQGTLAGFQAIHGKLLELDEALKTGKAEPRLGLEMLIVELAETAGRR